jgi:glycosyltransferase involved in cell wall biosynthesis
MTPLRLLFVKEAQNWPRASGHDVHGFHLMKALIARGHAVSLATVIPPTTAALDGLALESLHHLDESSCGSLPLTYLQRRFARYYGVAQGPGRSLENLLGDREFDAVVLVSRHLLPLLSVVRRSIRVWYPADDPAWHHLTRVKCLAPSTWKEVGRAAVNVVYERALRNCYDRVWVVSPADQAAMRVFSGCPAVDLVPNGVDAEYFQPAAGGDIPTSCVFWGRLDFDPNVDALEWFITRIWPAVLRRTPAARFAIYGFSPGPRVMNLAKATGVELHADVPDLRPQVTRRQVVVLPFVSGGGIKNKLLEAAALGMPIVCTRWTLSGARGKPAVEICRSSGEWAEGLAGLWGDSSRRRELGIAARRWVTEHHTWQAAAETAEAGIRKSIARMDASRPRNKERHAVISG